MKRGVSQAGICYTTDIGLSTGACSDQLATIQSEGKRFCRCTCTKFSFFLVRSQRKLAQALLVDSTFFSACNITASLLFNQI
jgi:hypothetical protein